MSAYDNVVSGKLKLKGKALDVKSAGLIKKKKKKHHHQQLNKHYDGESVEQLTELNKEKEEEEAPDANNKQIENDESSTNWDGNLTPAERRYMEQREKIYSHKLSKISDKSHRDRIEDFNQYLANMSEHYDIPKVGPG